MLKAIKSLFSGLLATVSPQRFADAGVKVDGFRIAEFKLVETAGMVAKAAIDCDIATTAKLEAAADATDELVSLLSKMKSYKADFIQTNLDARGTQLQESVGQIAVRWWAVGASLAATVTWKRLAASACSELSCRSKPWTASR